MRETCSVPILSRYYPLDDIVTVYCYAPRCSCKGLNFHLCTAEELYAVNKCELCFHIFLVHRRTVQQVPDFIHVDLEVGYL